jgi:hypothetical protein
MIRKAMAMLLMVALLSVPVLAQAQGLGQEQAAAGGDRAEMSGSDPAFVFNGWNYFHIANCYSLGSNLTLFPVENLGGYFVFTNTYWVLILVAACQTGKWVGVFLNGSGAALAVATWYY